MAREPIGHDQLCPQKITGTENLGDFRCSDPEFEEYLRVSALYDQSVGMGRTYAFMHEGLIAGYIVLAAAHVPDTEQKRLNIDTYGPVPGLVISHLATHKEYERRGVGRNMVLWAIDYARDLGENIGCRIVVVGADPEVEGFYEKIGFVHAKTGVPGASGSGILSRLKRWRTAKKGAPNMLYFDLGESAN